nr:unnamed protein product [Digitaria exilis]
MSASSLAPRFMPPCTGLHPAPPPPQLPPHPLVGVESSLEHARSPPPPPPISTPSTPAAADAGSTGRADPPGPRGSAGRRAGTARGGAEREAARS